MSPRVGDGSIAQPAIEATINAKRYRVTTSDFNLRYGLEDGRCSKMAMNRSDYSASAVALFPVGLGCIYQAQRLTHTMLYRLSIKFCGEILCYLNKLQSRL